MSNINELSEKEREYALSILKEMSENGSSDKMQQLLYVDYDEVPVDIKTFCHDKKYLGGSLYDPEGKFMLWPYWEEMLHKVFPDNITTAYNTIILTGAIGIGKTQVAVIILLYLLYRLLCLRDPYLYYGLMPNDKISISMMNITIENAKGVAQDKMNQMILASPWFLSHGEMAGTVNLEFRPDKHIEFIASSSNNQIIGRALFCLSGDTLIKCENGLSRIDSLVNKEFKVETIDTEGNIVISDTCTVLPTARTKEIIEITLEDGTVIKCTPNHRFMLKDNSYKEAQYLTEDDELFDTGSKGVINL